MGNSTSQFTGPIIIALIVAAASFLPTATASAGELGIDLFGLSYHLDRRDDSGRRFNEFNYGLGVNYTFFSNDRSRYYLEGAIYHDSYNYTARFGAVGYDYRLFDQLYFGLIVGLIDSRSVSDAGSIVGAVPMLRYRWSRVTFNLVHIPKFPGINGYPSFATYLTLWLSKIP